MTPLEIDRIYKIYRMRRKKINPVNLVNPVYFRMSLLVELRCPERIKIAALPGAVPFSEE
jgi:hypothetical protein